MAIPLKVPEAPDLFAATVFNSRVDLSPLSKLIDYRDKQAQQAREADIVRQKMGMEQERLGFERERMGREAAREPFNLRALETAAKLGESNLSYLSTQRQLEEEQKRAAANLARSHANYYDVMGGVAQKKVETGDYRAQTQRQKVYGDILQRTSLFQNRDEWERANQPGGIINVAFGGPQPWENRQSILTRAKYGAKAPPDEVELLDSGFDENTIKRMRRSKQMEGIYGKPKPGFIWDYDERMTPFQKPVADPDTAGERNSQVIARTGLKNLDDAEKLLNNATWWQRIVGDSWTVPGTTSARDPRGVRIGGYGKAGEGFKGAEMALLDLNFALSGKSVSNAEREAFMQLYMPTSTDVPDRRAFKFRKMREYFATVMDARKRGLNEDQIGDLYRSFLRDGQPQQQPQPQGPSAPSGQWSIRRLD